MKICAKPCFDIDFWASLNLVLAIIGYAVVATTFLPAVDPLDTSIDLESISQRFTIPYRALSLFLSLYMLWAVRKERMSYPIQIKVFFFYWGLWLIRIFFDLFVRDDIVAFNKNKTILFVMISFVYALSIVRSIKHINVELAYKFLLFLSFVSIIALVIKNPLFLIAGDMIETRMSGSIGINTISTALVAGILFILLFFAYKDTQLGKKIKALIILLLLITLIITTRAGSRGPVISLIAVLLFYYWDKLINPKNILFLFSFIFVIIVFYGLFLSFLNEISPVLVQRLTEKNEENVVSRFELYDLAWKGFCQSPLLGYAYGVKAAGNVCTYPHNVFVEAFHGLGIFGGIVFLLLTFYVIHASYKIVKEKKNFWVALICMYVFVESVFSGCFYEDPMLSALMSFVLARTYIKKSKLPVTIGVNK